MDSTSFNNIIEYGMGRIHAPDPNDHKYLMRMAMAAELPDLSALPSTRYYRAGPVLTQGNTGTCVGHAWRQWLSSAPLMTKGGPSAFDLYRYCLSLDEWQENDWEINARDDQLQFGTSVRAGAKAITQLGRMQTYVWAFSVDDMKAWLLGGHGTVVIGSLWKSQMFTPDTSGFVHVHGDVVGGHAYLCLGYSSYYRAFRFVNSWGEWWGQKGRFWMSEDDMALLLQEGGEACTAIEQKIVA